MKLKRIFALLMAVCMVLTFSACSKEKETGKKEVGGFEVVDPYTNDEVVDLDGYEFTIASGWLENDMKISEAGRIFKKRIEEVEKAYNCKISIVDGGDITTQILAGEKVADWIDTYTSSAWSSIAGEYFRPYDTIEGIDVKDSRWNKGYVGLTQYEGLSYGVNFMKPAEVRAGVFFNKTLIKKYGIKDNLYDLVRDKKWNFDKLREIAKACTKDTNGDGKTDVYGILFFDEYNAGQSFINANGSTLASVEGGRVIENLTDKKTLNAMNFLYDLCNVDKSVYINDAWRSAATYGSYAPSQTDRANMFVNNKAAFYIGDTWICNQLIKPMNKQIEYGFLPLPLGPDATEYVSPSHGARNFFVTVTNKDLDKAVPIMNALALPPEGYEGDAWWEEIIMNDYFQDGDTDSLEMYKLCLENMTYDHIYTDGTSDMYGEFVTQCVLYPLYFLQGSVSSTLSSMQGVPTDRLGALFGFE
ncbi:MAG: extracellular solute-binding protein [Clostridia bacterium]|nr:extracellular solute-binding protein [Clostridia bacterium]